MRKMSAEEEDKELCLDMGKFWSFKEVPHLKEFDRMINTS